jgi:hypothetical protein
MTTKEDVEARLAEILKELTDHTDAINELTKEQYELMNMLRTRFGL